VPDAPIASKVANALVTDATPHVGSGGLRSDLQNWMLGRFAKRYGGLWVGGRLTLTARTLEFHPNAVNRAVNRGTLDVVIELRDVTGVEVQPGVFTKIISVQAGDRVFRSRCYGAHQLADDIRAAAAATHGAAGATG
jgi:hypothetical protein